MEMYNPRSEYLKTVNEYLSISSNIEMLDYIDAYHRDKLNIILNELNSVDYRTLQKSDISVITNCLQQILIKNK